MASSVTPDAQTVVYLETVDRDRLMLAPVAGGAPTPLDQRETSQRNGAFSPDGRWLAYEEFTTRGGQSEVYVRALGSGQSGRRQVSADGGSQPRWTRGGRELVYRKGDRVLAVSFEPSSGEVGTPTLLFRKPDAGRIGGGRTIGYDVTPDGAQFLMVAPIERPGAQPTIVVLNWFEELRRKATR
jgi:Tol biopolymer transport system component